jgi:hypothetical protein
MTRRQTSNSNGKKVTLSSTSTLTNASSPSLQFQIGDIFQNEDSSSSTTSTSSTNSNSTVSSSTSSSTVPLPDSSSSDKSTNSKNKSRNCDPVVDEPTIGHIKRDEDDHHAVTIIASLDDKITLKQDICLICGSFGNDSKEGKMICCSQCGQSYHSYCSGINEICSVMIEKGWRCLDCTVCEGCGKATDESRLLLCDDCDISYHIYCLDPPLDHVPKGNWKCKWCVRCLKCGSKTPGPRITKKENETTSQQNSMINQVMTTLEWKNNYTECAICNSISNCFICNYDFTLKKDSILIKCIYCERWSHSKGDCKLDWNGAVITSETEADKLAERGFSCYQCRPALQLVTSMTNNSQCEPSTKINQDDNKLSREDEISFVEELTKLTKRSNCDEGFYLTDFGYETIRRIKIKPTPFSRKNRRTTTTNNNNNNNPPADTVIKKNDDDNNSRSSNEDDTNETENKKQEQLKPTVQKRHITIGLGGFNSKLKKKTETLIPLNSENGKVTNKRKKKSILEETVPLCIQEAFFGVQILAKCKEVLIANSSSIPALPPSSAIDFDNKKDVEIINKKLAEQKNKSQSCHFINLDENLFKSTGLDKKDNLELGIDGMNFLFTIIIVITI